MFVRTTDPHRQRYWQRVFGTDRLPVVASQPRLQCCIDGREILAYDLSLSKLTNGQRYRLAAHVARCQRRPYTVVLAELATAVSWPIAAKDCYIDEATELRPLPLFVWGRYDDSINLPTYNKSRLISGLAG